MSNNFDATSFLFGSNASFIEELYQQYIKDPSSIDASWRRFFEHQNDIIPLKTSAVIINNDDHVCSKNVACHEKAKSFAVGAANAGATSSLELSLKAKFMIEAYRAKGHYLAKLDPLGMEQCKTKHELGLDLASFGLSELQLNEVVDVSNDFDDLKSCSLRQLIDLLEHTYTSSIAAEFSHVEDAQERLWLYKQLEEGNVHSFFSAEERKKLLWTLVKVESFEQYLHTKFPGAKRFSIEGGEASILALDIAIEQAGKRGVEDVTMGLAHRGRLSTLTTIMQKPYRALFGEFQGKLSFPSELDVAGDVKYHMGYSSDREVGSHMVHLSLTPNPSHLEAVNPVVAGRVRAKQDLLGRDRSKAMAVLVHGDAAFCGQGIVAESLVMSGLKPYDVGGVFHVVINNQVGFTANPKDGRPGRYCTDVAKIVGAPILHINGDDIDAVALASYVACAYRAKFAKDIVLDIVCYRKYGHNEGDEPGYTQPLMYNIIKSKKTPAQIYADKLQSDGVIAADHYDKIKAQFKSVLDDEFAKASDHEPEVQWLEGLWSGVSRVAESDVITGVPQAQLKNIATGLCNIPHAFAVHPKLKKLFESRAEDIKNNVPIDWAIAEQLAFATLLHSGIPIRITGQDAGRGTFSHRHSVLHSQQDSSIYEPLNHISEGQAFFEVHDSNLSEYGVLGFEYGYSLVNPRHLVIWEAQFGDFCNGAQIIFDQFISATETKWLRMSGLVCLLPHAMEGQGPEHSSARLERFLQLCAENNMQVAYPTTPASIFHLLRRQMLQTTRKPLIVMSPKSLLRHKMAVSDWSLLDEGTKFEPVLDEIDAEVNPNKLRKVIICSGKIYYDLLDKRRASAIDDIAIIRLEQLYPFPSVQLERVLRKYVSVAKGVIWCQEEPQNMGAWKFVGPVIDEILSRIGTNKHVNFVGRPRSASPAVGYLYVHNKEQQDLLERAMK